MISASVASHQSRRTALNQQRYKVDVSSRCTRRPPSSLPQSSKSLSRTSARAQAMATDIVAPLLSLPNEILRQITLYLLEEWNHPDHAKARAIAPVSFDINLRNVCLTTKHLRDVCRPLLYRNAWVSICGIRSMESQQAHIRKKLFENEERCELIRLVTISHSPISILLGTPDLELTSPQQQTPEAS